jgi:ATP-dependent Zn protease
MNANLRNFALWVIIVLLLLALFTLFQNPGQRASSQDISFSQLLTEVDQNHVRDVVIQGRKSTAPSPTAQLPDLCAERPDAGQAPL